MRYGKADFIEKFRLIDEIIHLQNKLAEIDDIDEREKIKAEIKIFVSELNKIEGAINDRT